MKTSPSWLGTCFSEPEPSFWWAGSISTSLSPLSPPFSLLFLLLHLILLLLFLLLLILFPLAALPLRPRALSSFWVTFNSCVVL